MGTQCRSVDLAAGLLDSRCENTDLILIFSFISLENNVLDNYAKITETEMGYEVVCVHPDFGESNVK